MSQTPVGPLPSTVRIQDGVGEDTVMDAKIVCDPEILRGKPVLAGTRISVELILEKLASGYSTEDLLESYPSLTREGIQAALQFSLEVLRNEVVYPLAG